MAQWWIIRCAVDEVGKSENLTSQDDEKSRDVKIKVTQPLKKASMRE